MAIRVGFDNGHNPAAGRRGTQTLQVVQNRHRPDYSDCRCGHAKPRSGGSSNSGHEIFEPGILPAERQSKIADLAVSVLGDDDVGLPFLGRFIVVDLIAVDKHNEIRILLDRAGFTQI